MAKILFGELADRFDYRVILLGAMVLNTLGTLLLTVFTSSYGTMFAAAVLLGLGLGCLLPVWVLLIAREFGSEDFGRAMGVSRVITSPISMTGPVFVGWTYDWNGDYTFAFSLLIALQSLFGVMVLLIDRHNPLRGRLLSTPGRTGLD